ncbi:MAG: 2Fe-2S iron-sulfur cluster-binding protein [Elusimicrobiota bacterium]|jgi:NADH-quinone oxidoreductase subunit G
MADIALTIDDKPVSVPEGTLLIEAARKAGIEIPHYCWHPALGNPGVCRLCMVQVEGSPKPMIACRQTCKPGMIVRTNSELARRAQTSSLEFHLVNHPLDCPVCDQAGECLLQDYYQRYGLYTSSVREDKRHKEKRAALGPHVMLDAERCILCTRCTRFLEQVTRTRELGVFGRGDESAIALAPGKTLDNPYSACVADLCPVGALTERDSRFQVRVWYLDSTPTLCTGCGRGCSIFAQTSTRRPWHNQGRRLARIKPRHNPAVNGWWICDEGRYGSDWTDSKQRLLTASLLEKDGPKAVKVEDALHAAACELENLCRAKGPQGLAVLLSASLSNEDLFLARELFVRKLKVSRLLFTPGPERLGEEDSLLRVKEKVPNIAGGRALGLGSAVQETPWETLRKQILSGELWGLYCADRDPFAGEGEDLRAAILHMTFTLYQGPLSNAFARAARWVLPSCSPFEKDATYVNCEQRLQRGRKALEPLGESQPDWRLFAGILRALGEAPPQEAAAAFARIAKSEAAFQGQAFELPECGVPLSGNAP